MAYNAVLSGVEACADRQGGRRLLRTFCMKKCKSDTDCRSQYACIDIAEENPWQAEVVEFGQVNTRVCTVPFEGAMIPEDRAGNVCVDDGGASFPPPALPPGDDAGLFPRPADARADAVIDGTSPPDATLEAGRSDAFSDAPPEAMSGADSSFGDAGFDMDASRDATSSDAPTDALDASADVSGQ